MSTDVSAGLDALGDATRRAIVSKLAAGPAAVGELARGLPVGRPAVSMHLRVLKDAGLVADEAVGTRRLYRLRPEGLARLRDHLDWYWAQALAAYKQAAEQATPGGEMTALPEISVVRTVTVEAPLPTAFRVFTEQHRWWPVATHHLAEPPGETVVLEPFVGGRWYERAADGTECDWGTVLVWEPPHRLLLTWQIAPGWTYQPDPDRASQVEVRFTAESAGRTRVELAHRHLEWYGESAERMRAVLDRPTGVAGVLAAYAAAMASGAPEVAGSAAGF
jgi:DNA-binding transcriptional ArsR family regulator